MKEIFLTFFTTVALVAVAASLFLNTILGVFGWTATSIDTMHNLKASHQVVERMKKRHDQKKLKATRKFTKRAAKRVASTALAAATVGTVAVALTMTSLEVSDYCEEKQVLQEDDNILYGTQIEFDLEECIEEGKEESKVILSQLKNSSVKAVSSAFNSTVQYSAENWAAIKKACLQALQSKGEAAADLWDTAKSWLMK